MALSIDDELLQAHAAMGWAISRWARVEASLCSVFSAAAGITYSAPGYGFLDGSGLPVVFYAVENFRTKLQLVEAPLMALTDNLDEPSAHVISECWRTLRRKCDKAARHRNRLAHREMRQIAVEKPGRRVLLTFPYRNPKAHVAKPDGYATADLLRIGRVFGNLADQITLLALFVAQHPELRSRHVRRVENLMANIRAQGDLTALERVKRDLSWPE